jgi:DNA-binding transcriptional LysR family regulator
MSVSASVKPGADRRLLLRRVRLRQFELLSTFEQARTLSAAARAVHLSEPAASKLLKGLAADLDVRLFDRAGRSLRPTAAGQALIRQAAGLIGSLERTQAELEAIRDGLLGRTTVGAGMGASYVVVPRALVLLLAKAPGIAVEVREGPMEELFALLRDGRLDLVVGRTDPLLIEGDLILDELYDPPMCVVAGPHHPLARSRRVEWPALLTQAWILPQAGTPMRAGIEAVFRRNRQRPQRCSVESSSIQTNIMLLSESSMLWVVSADIAARLAELHLLQVLRVPRLRGPAPLAVVHLRDRALSPASVRLLQCLQHVSRSIPMSYREPRRGHKSG